MLAETPTGGSSLEAGTHMEEATQFSLNVSKLKYSPPKNYLLEYEEGIYRFITSRSQYLASVLPKNQYGTYLSHINSNVKLEEISFVAEQGKITAILGPNKQERKTLINLIATKVINGEAEGDIVMQGVTDGTLSYSKHMAFVPRKSLYIPGLTYYEMIYYAAELRCSAYVTDKSSSWSIFIRKRVEEVLDIMDLQSCRSNVIPEYPVTRGEHGCELRRLNIATEIVTFPHLIAIEDPTLDLELPYALKIYGRLKLLARRGHAIVCTMDKPSSIVYSQLDHVVLIAGGYSITSVPAMSIESYFTDKDLGYSRRKGTDLIDFVYDIASGVERSTTRRVADSSFALHEKFEVSSYYKKPSVVDGFSYSALPTEQGLKYYGYKIDGPSLLAYRTYIALCRALRVKFREIEIIKKTFGSSILVGLVVGYLQWNQGSYGIYTMTIVQVPYPQTANITAVLFFISIFVFVQQALNVHVICKKFEQFRTEQLVKCTPTLSFVIATALSEGPFVVFSAFIFANLIYWMTSMNNGSDNYFYFCNVLVMVSLVGLSTTAMMTGVLRREFVVRDMYLLFSFLMVLISGFPFQLPGVRDYIADIAVINPTRWAFEALMKWKFGQHYEDGNYYITPFGFNTFNDGHVFEIQFNFIVFAIVVLVLSLLPKPNVLKRRDIYKNAIDTSRMSTDSFDGTNMPAPRTSEMVKPLLFTRESSIVSNKSRLSVTVSQQGESAVSRGGTVSFQNINYYLNDYSRGSKNSTKVLDNVSGQFDWGKLSMVLGSTGSGKSTLLRVLAGEKPTRNADVTGSLTVDNKEIDYSIPIYQRAAFVGINDDFHRDITVEETLTYAMMLRCYNRLGLKAVKENVDKTLEILQLDKVRKSKTKYLLRGERRRLSIGEEIVAGPSILFIDEPTTGLGELEESVMLRLFREMVNQDKTVIATLHQPSAKAYELFDTLLLLSKGQVIYHGPASDATKYFTSAPCKFVYANYNNPADFLMDLASNHVHDSTGSYVSTSELARAYSTSEIALKIANAHRVANNGRASGNSSNSSNPMRFSEIDSDKGVSDSSNIHYQQQSIAGMLLDYFYSFNRAAICETMFKVEILTYRSFKSLFARKKLLLGTIILHILLACILGWILGDSYGEIYNVTSFFAVGTLLLMIANIQLAYYMVVSQRIFLKENSRQLYNIFPHWVNHTLPVTLLKIVNAAIYAAITRNILNLDDDPDVAGFYYYSTMASVVCAFYIAECIISFTPDVRVAYLSIPAVAFSHFTFSGLFIKYQSLPSWLAPWMPSVSIIRWALQGEFINEFDPQRCTISPECQTGACELCTFPTIEGNTVTYSTWDALLTLFGWGGKTKYFCASIIILWLVLYKVLAYIGCGCSIVYFRRSNQVKYDIDE